MIGIALAAAMAALTPAQQADMHCLDVGATLAEGDRLADSMSQFYLARLRQSDPNRDWEHEARPINDITYDDVIDHLRACRARMARPQQSDAN